MRTVIPIYPLCHRGLSSSLQRKCDVCVKYGVMRSLPSAAILAITTKHVLWDVNCVLENLKYIICQFMQHAYTKYCLVARKYIVNNITVTGTLFARKHTVVSS